MILKGMLSQPLRLRRLAAGAAGCAAGAAGADPAEGTVTRAPGRGGMGCASAGWFSAAVARNQTVIGWRYCQGACRLKQDIP